MGLNKMLQVVIVHFLMIGLAALSGEKVSIVSSMILFNVLIVSRIVWDMKKEE